MFLLFFEGAALGFAISAPVGPINLLCMKRSLTHGRRIGFLTGLGAASGDAFYGAVAAFGLSAISDFFVHYQTYFQIFGGVLFFAMGVKLLRQPAAVANPSLVPAESDGGGNAGEASNSLSGRAAFVSTLFLTMTNPATILAFLTAFASLNFAMKSDGWSDPLAITIGVFAGSAAWWLILSQVSAKFSSKLNAGALRRINQFAGVLLILFGSVLLMRGLK